MAGIIIFQPGHSSWAASGGAFMNIVESISTKLDLDIPTVEANMLLDLSIGDTATVSILIESINETWQKVLEEHATIENISSSYLLSLSDLKTLALFNLFKHQGKIAAFDTGPLGTIKYRDCSWSAPRHIFNHLVERFAAGARNINALALTKLLIKTRVETEPTSLDLTLRPSTELALFEQFTESQMTSYLNKKGLRFADQSLFAMTLPYAQLLGQFLSCVDSENTAANVTTTHLSSPI